MFIHKDIVEGVGYDLIPRKGFTYITVKEAQDLFLSIDQYFKKQEIKPKVKFLNAGIFPFPPQSENINSHIIINKADAERLPLQDIVQYFYKLALPSLKSRADKGKNYNLTVSYNFNKLKKVEFGISSETIKIEDGKPDEGYEVSKKYPISVDAFYKIDTKNLKTFNFKRISKFEKWVEKEYHTLTEYLMKDLKKGKYSALNKLMKMIFPEFR